MAKWEYACKTAQGMDLDLKLFSRGMPLKMTKSMSGAGKTSPTQLMLLQDVAEPVQELRILDAVERLGEDVIRIPIMLKNKGIAEGYSMHQIGIFAEDPDAGEILYIVMQSDSAEEIPSAEEMKDFTLEWYLNLSVGNAQEVTVVVDETDVLTTEQADAKYVAKNAASDTEVTFEEPAEKSNIESGETLSTLFGKIKKVFADLKNVAFSGSYNDLKNKPTIPEAVRVKGNAEADYHTGDVNITPANIGLGNVGNFKAVSTMASQGLSETEKSNARLNIGAIPTSHASTATTYGASSSTNYGHAMASSTTPKANGTAAVGSETTKFARGDHVHPLQTSVTGNAATATKLAAARTIRTSLASTSTASFDGSANITPGVSGVLPIANGGTGNTTGNAPTATKATNDGNGNNIVDTYETKAGNTWKKIKTIAYNGTATASRNVYKELKIVAYITKGSGAVVYGIYDFPTSILDNVADNSLYFSDTSVMDAYFYATLNGNTVIVENSYKGMTIELYGK